MQNRARKWPEIVNIYMQYFFLLLVSNTIPKMMDPPLAIWRLQPSLHELLLLLSSSSLSLLLLLQCCWWLSLIITVLFVIRCFILYTVYAWISMMEQLRFSFFLLGFLVLNMYIPILNLHEWNIHLTVWQTLVLWFPNYHLWEWEKMVVFFRKSVHCL